jgi:hypothetical protein
VHQYHYQASTEALDALRKLRAPWARLHAIDTAVTIVLADGSAVVVQVEAADVEDAFEAFRLTAMHDPSPMVYGEPIELFSQPGNDIVVFTGATWSEPNGQLKDPLVKDTAVMHFSGHPGQISETAEVVCITTDAVVIATTSGAGLLIRTGLKPYSLDVVRDPDAVREFLLQRGYANNA